DAGAPLPLGVEPGLPEDEDRDQRQERQPLRLGVPGDAPERQRVLVVEPAKREGEIEAEREAADVDREQRRDRREPSRERSKRRSGEDRGSRRPDVGRDGSALLLRRRLRVRRDHHEARFYCRLHWPPWNDSSSATASTTATRARPTSSGRGRSARRCS